MDTDKKSKSLFKSLVGYWRSYIVIITPLILLPLIIQHNSTETRCAFVLLVMAVYWITEAVPIFVTAFIPIFALPLLGIVSSMHLAPTYIKEASIVLTSSLMVAAAIEHSKLHIRMALILIKKIGQSPKLLLAGFMITPMLISMWVVNAAAAAVMIPVVDGILEVIMTKPHQRMENGVNYSRKDSSNDLLDEKQDNDISNASAIENQDINTELQKQKLNKLKHGFYLAVLYGSNIGGTGVLTGTPPNIVLSGVLAESFEKPTGLNFTSWMMLMIPTMLISVSFGWVWLVYRYIGFSTNKAEIAKDSRKDVQNYIEKYCRELGPMSYQEKSVATLFCILIPLWIFRNPGFITGWAQLINSLYESKIHIGDSTPVVFITFLLFILPARNPVQYDDLTGKYFLVKSESLLTWKIVHEKVPWGVIILLGGGFAMAKGADVSGLSSWIGSQLGELRDITPAVIVLIITTLTACLTEIMSNNATTAIILPILKELSLNACINPLYIMIPATVSASFAFMLPVAAPPNAIIYHASGMKSTEMMKAGFPMNIICILVVNAFVNTLGNPIFDIHHMPQWANSSTSGTLPVC